MFTRNLLEAVNSVVNPSTVQEILQESKIQIDQWLQKEVLNQEQYQEILRLFNTYNNLMKSYKGQIKNIATDDFFEQPEKQKAFLDQFQFSQWFSKANLQGNPLSFEIIKSKIKDEIERLEWYHENAPTEKSIRSTKSKSKEFVDLTQEFPELKDKPFEILAPLDHITSGKIASSGYKGIQANVCVAKFQHFSSYNKRGDCVLYLIMQNEKITIAYSPETKSLVEAKNSKNYVINEEQRKMVDEVVKILNNHLPRMKEILAIANENNAKFHLAKKELNQAEDTKTVNAVLRKHWKFRDDLILEALSRKDFYENIPFMKRLFNSKKIRAFDSETSLSTLKKFKKHADHFDLHQHITPESIAENINLIHLMTDEQIIEYLNNIKDKKEFEEIVGSVFKNHEIVDVKTLQRVLDDIGYKAFEFDNILSAVSKVKEHLKFPRFLFDDENDIKFYLYILGLVGEKQFFSLIDSNQEMIDRMFWEFAANIDSTSIRSKFNFLGIVNIVSVVKKHIQEQLNRIGFNVLVTMEYKIVIDVAKEFLKESEMDIPTPTKEQIDKRPILRIFSSVDQSNISRDIKGQIETIVSRNIKDYEPAADEVISAIFYAINIIDEMFEYVDGAEVEAERDLEELFSIAEAYHNGETQHNSVFEELLYYKNVGNEYEDEDLVEMIENFQDAVDKLSNFSNIDDIADNCVHSTIAEIEKLLEINGIDVFDVEREMGGLYTGIQHTILYGDDMIEDSQFEDLFDAIDEEMED